MKTKTEIFTFQPKVIGLFELKSKNKKTIVNTSETVGEFIHDITSNFRGKGEDYFITIQVSNKPRKGMSHD